MIYSVLKTKSQKQARIAMTNIYAQRPRYTYKDGWYEIFADYDSQEQAHNASIVLRSLVHFDFDMRKMPRIQTFKEMETQYL